MNGIIHPCVHPEGRPAPETVEEMYSLIFALFFPTGCSRHCARRLLFMAIDERRRGRDEPAALAPRLGEGASRRGAADKALRAEMRAAGHEPPPEKAHGSFDSNVITPGTEFMGNLAQWLQYYIQLRVSTSAAWKGIKVILSDASVPGEGEHKIMEHIRLQRLQPGYDANQRHVIHGLDADLIMLALATHEPHFTILRELVLDRKAAEKRKERQDKGEDLGPMPLQMLQIWTLREYLHREFCDADFSSVPGCYDLERVIDDFVFLCFFVGNDFLPHIPALEIHDGAIDMLMCAISSLRRDAAARGSSSRGRVSDSVPRNRGSH